MDVYFGAVKDGFGLTVEICNAGDVQVEDIQLDVTIENGKFVIVPKKSYDISNIAAGSTAKIRVFVFGLGFPIFSVSLHAASVETIWKNITARVFFTNTNILSEHSSYDEPYFGYTIFSPEYSTNTYLIDINGKIIHTWKSNYIQSFGSYLLENGDLLRLDLPFDNTIFRAGGVAGRVEKFDEDSTLLWEFEYSNNQHCAHHDIEPLPNGNVMLIAWEYKTKDEAIAAGRDPNKLQSDSLWPDHIIEVQPTGTSGGDIVWEWHAWDHLIQDFDAEQDNYGVVGDHPELIDLNYGGTRADWTHTNSIDYHEEFDQILLSVLNFNEIWVIDHSTTTAEAAGHTGGNSGKGGDLLYRWGNPQAYDAGTSSDQKFFSQHGANWIEAGCPGEGNILVFNNGGRTRDYSSVDEIIPPIDSNGNYNYTPGIAYEPENQIWIYTAENPHDLFSTLLSNTQRLPNGNTLICSALQGLFLEVSPEKNIVWKYQNILPTPLTNAVARIQRYPPDYPGIPETVNLNTKGKNLYAFFTQIPILFSK